MVETTLEFNFVVIEFPFAYDCAKADWSNFRKNLNDKLNLIFHIKSAYYVENQVNIFLNEITDALRRNVPLRKSKFFKYVRDLIKLENELRKECRISQSPYQKNLKSESNFY